MSTVTGLLGLSYGLKPKYLTYLVGTSWPTSPATGTPGTLVTIGGTTANTLKTILSITGAGAIGGLKLELNAVARTNRIKITMDGIVVLDTSKSQTAAAQYHNLIGNSVSNNGAGSSCDWINEWFMFDKSLLIEYASNLTETNSSTISYNYMLR